MNLSALKTFAPAVRKQLIEAVTRKLDFVLTGDTADLRAMSAQRGSLRRESTRDRQGLVERVAYTWFNRFAALRFIDAHGWHPFGVRVLTAATAEETQPELLRLARSGQLPADLATHTDPDRLDRLLDGALPSTNPQGEVYRHLVLAACRFYHTVLPVLFEKLDDDTEMLLPDDLLTEHSVVHGFRTEIADADCAEVEILGWLYQFYISEKKDQVMARKSAVPTEDIPAVTQLFTPHWIVRYLVENSLGRLWLLNRPQSRLRAQMPYYIEGEAETDFLEIGKPEEIKLIDPAAGSGHMLTYAFDLLYAIYEEEGYAPSDIPALILRHNLQGVEICERAAALAAFALCMKARSRDNRFFRRVVQPQVIALQDVHFAEGELADYFRALQLDDSLLSLSGSDTPHSVLRLQQLSTLLHQFEEAKSYGSLIQPCLTEPEIQSVRSQIENRQSRIDNAEGQLFLRETHRKVLRVLEQATALTQRYHVVVANPPYMTGGVNPRLGGLLESNFGDSKYDLSATFVTRARQLCVNQGQCALVTMHSWMFLSSLVDFRKNLLSSCTVINLTHHGIGAFPTLNSKVVQTAAFVIKNGIPPADHIPICFRLLDYDPELKERQLLNRENRFATLEQCKFSRIGGSPLAYWLSPRAAHAFVIFPPLSEIGETRIGLITGDNGDYLRFWHEVGLGRVGFRHSRDSAAVSGYTWFPQSKGGNFRRWYGNNETVVDWSNDGQELQTRLHDSGKRTLAHNFNLDRIFQPAVTWTKISSGKFSARLQPEGFLFNDASANLFVDSTGPRLRALAFLNSSLCPIFLGALNPTLNFLPGNVSALPLPKALSESAEGKVLDYATSAVALARTDWDDFETSWDFRDQPLLRSVLKGVTLEASWRNWEAQSIAAIRRMQELETENNRLFIAAYGLQDELKPEVPEEQITLSRADLKRDMAAFLSYAVGCMMGRYSLDAPGLILADAGATLEAYLVKVPTPLFSPDEDGILPVLDGEWFEDDIVGRSREFLRVTFGEDSLAENIRFIEESLGKDLRKYFLSDFYKSHLQVYKKRPIYWLFRSPKGGFAVLVYLHRMTRDTPNLILNRYLRDYLQKLRARIEHLDHAQATAATARDKTAARKESDQLKKTLRECEDWERDVLLPLAQSRPELDLDDGVKVNYLKLGEALAPIPGLAAKEEE